MGALATGGGAVVALGTPNAGAVASSVGTSGTTKAPTAPSAATGTTYLGASVTSFDDLSKLIADLQRALASLGQPAPVVPKAAPPQVNEFKPNSSKPKPAPSAFIWNSHYYKAVAPVKDGFDDFNKKAVSDRAVLSALKFMQDDEKVDDFGVTGFKMRAVSVARDADLLNVNPGARWVVDVSGTLGDGSTKSLPVVVNTDGRTYVDPRIHF